MKGTGQTGDGASRGRPATSPYPPAAVLCARCHVRWAIHIFHTAGVKMSWALGVPSAGSAYMSVNHKRWLIIPLFSRVHSAWRSSNATTQVAGRPEQPPKAPWPMRTALVGARTAIRLVQSLNARSPMEVAESGMSTAARDEQPRKAQWPMQVAESGMSTAARDEQARKA